MIGYRLSRNAIVFFLLMSVTLGASAAVVTVDVGKKTAASDTGILTPGEVVTIGDQASVVINSAVAQSKTFKLRFQNAPLSEYDLYIDGKYLGVKKAKDLAEGISAVIPASPVDPVKFHTMRLLLSRAQAELKRIDSLGGAEAERVRGTLRQVEGWAESALTNEATYRAIEAIIVPPGRIVENSGMLVRNDAKTIKGEFKSNFEMLQNARDVMYHQIKDTYLHNATVLAMTPVDMLVTYVVKKSVPRLYVRLVNNSELPISGNISAVLSAGWKTDSKKARFKDLPSGQTFQVTLDLLAKPKGAPAPASISVFGNVVVATEDYFAKCVIRIVAQKSVPPALLAEPKGDKLGKH